MKNTLCLLGVGRTGTSLVADLIRSDKNYTYLDEFFNVKSTYCCIKKKLEIISELHEHDTSMFNEFLEKLGAYVHDNHEKMSDYKSRLDLFGSMDSMKLFKELSNLYKTDLDKNILLKVFPIHLQLTRIKPAKLFAECNNLIVIYRKNILNCFISHQKGLSTKIWYIKESEKTKKKHTQIVWNKQKFLDYYDFYTTTYNNDIKFIYNSFLGEKCRICYEDLIGADSMSEYLNSKFIDNQIPVNVKANASIPVRQTSPDVTLPEHFVNTDVFWEDYPDIKSKIMYEY